MISRKIVDHINHLFKLMIKHIKPGRYSYLKADMILKKLYLFIIDPTHMKTNDLDIVEYHKSMDHKLIDDPVNLLETYIKRGIHKRTGIMYSEFKDMTIYERNILLTFIALETGEETIVNEETDKVTDILDNKNAENLLSGFDVGRDYI